MTPTVSPGIGRTPPTTAVETVSVCIPTFNNAAMISDAINSALAQSYSALDICVVDNCSSDDTEIIVRALMQSDPRIRYLRQPFNIGMVGNFNSCLEQARGDLVIILCSDDMLEQQCVEELVAALNREPSAIFVACARTFIDEKMQPIKVVRSRRKNQVISGMSLTRELVYRGNIVGEPSAVMFKKRFAGTGFDPEYSQLVDLEMWLRFASSGPALYLARALCKVRQHSAQMTKSNLQTTRLIIEKRRLFRTVILDSKIRLSTFQKLFWDTRMLRSITRLWAGSIEVNCGEIDEVFYKPLFLAAAGIIRPCVSLAAHIRNHASI